MVLAAAVKNLDGCGDSYIANQLDENFVESEEKTEKQLQTGKDLAFAQAAKLLRRSYVKHYSTWPLKSCISLPRLHCIQDTKNSSYVV